MTTVATTIAHQAGVHLARSPGLDYVPIVIIGAVVVGVMALYIVATRWHH